MPLGELTRPHHVGGSHVEFTQAKQIRDRGSIEPDLVGDLLVGEGEFVRKAPQRVRTLHRIEILALDVLHQRQLGCDLIVDRSHHRGDHRESDQLRGTPPALTSDELETA